MNIAFLTASINWSTFNQLLGLGAPQVAAKPIAAASSQHPTFNAQASRNLSENTPLSRVNRPLRVVRLMEVGQTPSQVGRMVISGRMADVCAELDRLVAHEAAMH